MKLNGYQSCVAIAEAYHARAEARAAFHRAVDEAGCPGCSVPTCAMEAPDAEAACAALYKAKKARAAAAARFRRVLAAVVRVGDRQRVQRVQRALEVASYEQPSLF